MRISVNTDNHITNSENFNSEITESLAKKLEKFSSYITTVEIYFSDENNNKGGADDKKCLIEARLEGLDPLAVSENSATLREAFHESAIKIERVIRKAIDKQQAH